ncbi:MAG: type I pullulanase, partial [Clostridia bacterium]|nr:type I pullulanase [Clostridia bacterium]
MKLKRTLSAVIMAAMLSSVICTGGAVTASAAKAGSVDGIDPADFSTYTTYDGELGALYTAEATTFRVWAPTASDVKLRLYTTGSDKEEGAKMISETQMEIDKKTGVWSVRVEGDQKNTYYTYVVKTVDNPDGVEVVDIYAKAAGVNGDRGMVVDLDSTDPEGWAQDTHKLVDSPTAAEVWEVHIKDFSYDSESGVSDQYRGKYMAFTELQTTLNNAGSVKTCMNYLKDLGVNYVQINPMYDFGSVNEASDDDTQFNWGYDPKNYNVPEGSYSTNPYDGNVRITEMKTMIKTLHENGIGVIMDVVYNHTYASQDSWFNLTVPNYYYRIKPDGTWSNGSGCGNDTASEREMYKKFMVDSVTYWAEEYHIDGFRFDLMGLHYYYTMNAVRDSLDQIDTRIIMYGEGWSMDTYPDEKNWAGKTTSMCSQPKVKRVSKRIGFFNDDIRDALKGKAFDDLTSPGYVSGDLLKAGVVYASITGHYTPSNWSTSAASQNVVYSCCHDNQTLWDRLVASEYGSAADDKYYDMRNENFVSGNKLSGAIVFTSQGIPFILAGEEYGRTKYGDHNSYRSSPDINKIDWSRTVEYADIVSYYKGLIQLRNAYPGFTDPTLDTAKAIELLETPAGVIGYKLPNIVDTSGKTWSNVVVYF